MRIRPAHLLLCGMVLLGPVAACGKDKKDDASSSSSSSTTEGDTSTTKAGSSGNAELTKFCADVDAFVKDAEPILKSKDRDGLDALESRGNDLSSRAETIQSSIDSSDLPTLAACQKKFTDLAQAFAAAFSSAG